ncbi:MAG: hypothetical protein WBA23_21670 [Tunicatimonas sp.]|uniref:hypothetical protein n=1 Tax=Tunicatimonas sp. TaxID=1940096 RepID=UPI003C70D5B7
MYIYRAYLAIFTSGLLFLSACDEVPFNFVLNLDDTYEYDISDDGVISEEVTVSRERVVEDLEIDSETTVEDVNVESLAIKIMDLNGNQASAVRLAGLFYPQLGANPIALFEDLELAATADGDFTAITDLESAGVNALADKLLGYINDTDFNDFIVTVEGVSVPDGSRVEAQVAIKLRATVKFSETVEAPFFVGQE